MLKLKRKGQSTLEFAVLATVLLAALLTMQIYIKRGIQGRWKNAIDDIGDQYDPRYSDTIMNQSVSSNSVTNIYVQNVAGGQVTMREDTTESKETLQSLMVTVPQ